MVGAVVRAPLGEPRRQPLLIPSIVSPAVLAMLPVMRAVVSPWRSKRPVMPSFRMDRQLEVARGLFVHILACPSEPPHPGVVKLPPRWLRLLARKPIPVCKTGPYLLILKPRNSAGLKNSPIFSANGPGFLIWGSHVRIVSGSPMKSISYELRDPPRELSGFQWGSKSAENNMLIRSSRTARRAS